MNIFNDPSEWMDLFSEVSNHCILARLFDTFPVRSSDHYYLQCALLPISDEPDFVLEKEKIFWEKSKKNGRCCYTITGDMLLRALNVFGENSITEEDVMVQKEKLEKLLTDKIILFKPFFKYDAMKDCFYKNVDYDYSIRFFSQAFPNESYFVLPVLNQQNYKLFLQHKTFSLFNWNYRLFGKPSYLVYQNSVIYAPLTTTDQSDYNFQWLEKEELEFLELKFDQEKLEKLNLFSIEGKSEEYCFLEKTALSSMTMNIPPKEEEPVLVENQNSSLLKKVDAKKILHQFDEYLKSKNLYYYEEDIRNFHACLKSGMLTILAGMSGTGKTRLPLEYAHFFNMNEENKTLLFVPVSPSYSEPSDMLGFYNPVDGMYIPSETGLASFLKHAFDNKDKMHMVIFDEMNLAQIEYYFAPFLSIMERDNDKRYLTLYDENLTCKNKDCYPAKIHILDNVLFVGTINLDETTKELSDRLLDRSFVISLKRATFDKFNGVMSDKPSEKIEPYEGDLLPLMNRQELGFNFNSFLTPKMREFFDEFNLLMAKVDPQKGISFRTVKNIALYLTNSNWDDDELTAKQNFDFAIRQTIMRKIKGSNDAIREIVGERDEEGNLISPLNDLFDKYSEISSFDLCRNDLSAKILELDKYGYAR